ncbi:unnamed protein product (mitochondrion) [Plasmodiophora brassicae]|uniref:Dynein assembly factor 1, axonemal homolog n=1 Tax=Plasmodiophora brassicae TaxID=37360 RepID=A0A0G4IJA1_PLABS|nr:hypothetical protein PBRA_004082 [Plasmodiophora brassicae]SPQ96237.1 unnamed protein product [Plasmodiophora brassicae]
MEMTKEALRKICRDLKLYTTPEVNDKLYLHYKGFQRVENLEEYVGLRALWLEGNGFACIEGLDALVELRCLYLQENCISVMENLDSLVNLDTINLNNNMISRIAGISTLSHLRTLMLANNKIKEVDDMGALVDCAATLSVVDLSNNLLHDGEGVLHVLEQLPELKVLYLKGNALVTSIPSYRKTVITRLKNLAYLDDRPVFPDERLCAKAWASGGIEAERKERTRLNQERNEADLRRLDDFDAMINEYRQKARAEGQSSDEGDTKDDDDDDLFGERSGEAFGIPAQGDDDEDDHEDDGEAAVECPDLEVVGRKLDAVSVPGEPSVTQ